MSIEIRRAETTEIAGLASFAETCFREAFAADFPPVAMDRLCAQVFALPIVAALIGRGVWLAAGKEGWRGYIALGDVRCPIPELTHPVAELARLYVPRRWQGQGVADALMERFFTETGHRGAHGIWLQAYERNPRALAFYRRWGFQDFGPFDLECEGILLPHRALGRNLS